MHKELNRSGFYYGFPVLLATTKDQKGQDDITVLSSSWTLGDSVVLGIGVDNKGYKNIQNGSDITLNFCDESLLEAIKKIEDNRRHYQAACRADGRQRDLRRIF